MNWTLFSMMFSIASTVLIGIFMIIAVVIGYDEIPHIISTVIAGIVVSIPVAIIITKKLGKIGLDS